jgi:hypothetical protein
MLGHRPQKPDMLKSSFIVGNNPKGPVAGRCSCHDAESQQAFAFPRFRGGHASPAALYLPIFTGVVETVVL